jgi:hypothetical protein
MDPKGVLSRQLLSSPDINICRINLAQAGLRENDPTYWIPDIRRRRIPE